MDKTSNASHIANDIGARAVRPAGRVMHGANVNQLCNNGAEEHAFVAHRIVPVHR